MITVDKAFLCPEGPELGAKVGERIGFENVRAVPSLGDEVELGQVDQTDLAYRLEISRFEVWSDYDHGRFLVVTALSPNVWTFIDAKSWKGPQSSYTCHDPLFTPAPLLFTISVGRDVELGRVAFSDMVCGRCDLSSSLRSAVCSRVALCPRDLLVEELSQTALIPLV